MTGLVPCSRCSKPTQLSGQQFHYHKWFGYICGPCEPMEGIERDVKGSYIFNYGKPRFIYLAHAESMDRYKIGYTTNIEDRRRNLSCGSPVHISMIYQMRGSRHLEQNLHAFYRDCWSHGEWFDFIDIDPIIEHLNNLKRLRSIFESSREYQPQ